MNIEEHSRKAGHETTDVAVGAIAKFLIILTISMIVIGIALALLFGFFVARQGAPPQSLDAARELPPQPRLQVMPAVDLNQLRARENELLGSYAWVDRQNGVARIPIDQAMDAIARKGLPARAPQQAKEKK